MSSTLLLHGWVSPITPLAMRVFVRVPGSSSHKSIGPRGAWFGQRILWPLSLIGQRVYIAVLGKQLYFAYSHNKPT